MTEPQALTLTDAQIDATYNHFEHGDDAPQGVILSSSYTKTMGRVWSDYATGAGGGFIAV